MTEIIVLDASVGAKWFRDEPGSDEARDLLKRHGTGALRIVVPAIFVHEVLDVARRFLGVTGARGFLDRFEREAITVVSADTDFMRITLDVCDRLGCTVYDAAAPALASMLDVPLVSADRRAHARIPGARLIG